ncbi:MAG: cysteine protease StiP family protein [Fibrobacterota bacterium]|nr:MAG: cysteine protease StiP family protein [Fibrobacterota bacterium]
MAENSFCGSYRPEDCVFLLKPISLESVSVEEKERLIQSGKRHYSQMITAEKAPSEAYLRLFDQAMDRNGDRLAQDLLVLAREMDRNMVGPITLVSLARAGTPIGALLGRLLRSRFSRDCLHYSVSIVRDRGVDHNALAHILRTGRPDTSVVFVDGWTGKGTISRELTESVSVFNGANGTRIDAGVWTVADLSGSAAVSATGEDYLVPSSILNSTVSGLVSRTILHEDHVGPLDFHGCLHYRQFETIDRSNWFLDTIERRATAISMDALPEPLRVDSARSSSLRDAMESMLGNLAGRFPSAANRHFVKPGIGESTRVLLRRVPQRLLLSEPEHPEAEHLRMLAREKNVPMEIDPALPVKAVALIRELD